MLSLCFLILTNPSSAELSVIPCKDFPQNKGNGCRKFATCNRAQVCNERQGGGGGLIRREVYKERGINSGNTVSWVKF